MKQILLNYFQLVKFRLTSTVAATSAFGYILGCKINNPNDWTGVFRGIEFAAVIVGGMLVIFASNGLNQVVEKENDGKMARTSNRPVVEGRISINNARIFCLICGTLGIAILGFYTNYLTSMLGLISLLIYVFIYTPMKQVSPLAVLVGAIPGALPPLIGYTAVVGRIDEPGIILFLVQFFWQFPHFWAIAWLLHDDYQKAGYWLLPSKGGRDKKSAYQILIYTVILALVSLMPVYYKLAGIYSIAMLLPISAYFCYRSYKLFQSLEISDARKLLYASFLYTPLVFLAYIIF